MSQLADPESQTSPQTGNKKKGLSPGGFCLYLIVLGGVAWFGYPLWLDIQFEKLQPDPSFPSGGEMQLWTHRGHWENSAEKQNSDEAVMASEQAGFAGTEIDIWYVEKDGFLVAHDKETTAESRVQLADVFEACDSSSFQFWLDMKWLNQADLTPAAIAEGAQLLHRMIEDNSLSGRVFVECSNPIVLASFCEQCPSASGILWLPDWERMPPRIRKTVRRTIVKTDIRIVSRPIEAIRPGLPDPFAHLTRFYYTAEDEQQLALAKTAGASVVLVDGDAASTNRE